MWLCPSTPGHSRNSKPRRAYAVGAGHALLGQQRKGRNSRKAGEGGREINQKTLGGSWHRTKQHLSGSSKQHHSTNEQEGGSKGRKPNLKSRTRSNSVPKDTQISLSCQLESHSDLLPFPGVQCFLMQDLYSHIESWLGSKFPSPPRERWALWQGFPFCHFPAQVPGVLAVRWRIKNSNPPYRHA